MIVNPTSPLSRNKKSRNKKKLLLQMTCQCLNDYVKEAFHMLMHLLMMMMSMSLIVMMMMHLMIPKHILTIRSNISNVRYSIFYYVHDDDTLKLYTYYSC